MRSERPRPAAEQGAARSGPARSGRAGLGTVVVVLLVLLAAACTGGGNVPAASRGSGGHPTASAGPSGELLVFAAASLTDAFREVGAAFEQAEPGVSVRFNFAGSQELASQVLQGAPADVLASANPEQMQRVVEAGLTATEPSVFALNDMTIVVEPGNPERIGGLEDLAREDLVVVLAGEEVPAGRYASRVLERAGVELQPDSREVDVRQVLAKVTLGEADAAIVYASDAVAAGDEVATVPVPEAADVGARYPVAVLDDAPDPPAARAFVAFLRSPEARSILRAAGFTTP